MADAAAPSLGDFFKSKSKKKVKASNLNKDTTTAKPEETKKKTGNKEDEAWEEEKVEASTMQVAVAGKLMREEEKKDDDDTSAPAWGDLRKNASSNAQINEKRYPTLAKSVAAINVDDGSDNRVNIQTSKNHFAALEGNADSDDDDRKKGPKNIAPAMVSKKKGEFAKAAVQREVEKVKKDAKKKAKKEGDEEEQDEEEDEEEDEAEEQVEEEARTSKKKPSEKKEKNAETKKPAEEEADDLAEDLKIQVDLVASKEKYKGRKKLPAADLPVEELEENKENKQKQNTQPAGGKKKKMFIEEDTDKKLSYAPF